MREGSAEVVIGGGPEAAFAWLADPRNAGEWFASVALPTAPERPLRAGAVWRFDMMRQPDKSIPMRLAEYQPPRAFMWETAYPAWRDNLQWALALTPEPASAGGEMTRLRVTIRQRPGPLGWPLVLLAALFARLSSAQAGSITARAASAAERARDALAATPTLSYGPYERRGERLPRKDGRRRGHPRS